MKPFWVGVPVLAALFGFACNQTKVGTVAARMPNGKIAKVAYKEVDGLAVFEGDIILGRVGDPNSFGERVRNEGPRTHPEGFGYGGGWKPTIPYCIDSSVSNPQRVRDAAAHWSANTKFKLFEDPRCHNWFQGNPRPKNPPHLDFVFGGGCRSYIAYRPGSDNGQPIYLADDCGQRAVRHEIGHALGLLHEHSRLDRDSFITVVTANVMPGELPNFEIVRDGTLIGSYDYDSIMHYDAFAFSVQPGVRRTIVAPGGRVFGIGPNISAGDIAAANIL